VRWLTVPLLAVATGVALFAPLPQLLLATVWSVLVLVAFGGYGAMLRRLAFRDRRIDSGLLCVWGASIVCFIGGVLGALSLLRRPVLISLVVIGIALAAVAVVRPLGAPRRTFGALVRLARRHPLFALLCVVTFGVVLFHYVAAIADSHINPYDDEIAYLSFVKKLLDTGSFPEPFSLRRLSALGGQTVFVGLVAPRATMGQGNTFDHAMCLAMVVLLIVGYRSPRAPSLFFRMAATIFLCVVPNMAINTASYFSGVVFVLGLFRSLVAFESKPPKNWWAAPVTIGAIAAALCTLRQNYMPVPAIMVGAWYLFLFKASPEPWIKRLREPILVGVVTVAAVLPYCVMSWISNHTFLFPVVMGDANPSLQLQASDNTLAREATMAITTLMDGVPIRTMPILLILFAMVRERRPGRPIWALAASVFGGFLMTVHAFTQADVLSLGRYVFSGAMALTLVLILEAGTQMPRRPTVMGRRTVAGVLALSLVLVEILELRPNAVKTYEKHFENIDAHVRATRTMPRAIESTYARLQAAVPAGAPIAVILDEPLFLDYARNTIYNIDMPGFASPSVGGEPLPFFQGSAKVSDYFRRQSIDYIAFVRPDRSRYHYRRDYWIERLSDDMEVWRNSAPYVIDMENSLEDLARHNPVLFEEHGIVLLKLRAPDAT
jgi:hypothetical protein